MRAAAVLVLSVIVARTTHGDPTEQQRSQAAALAADAFQHIKDANDYKGAVDLFQRAFDASHELEYLLDIAVAARKDGSLPHQAVVAYRRYLELAGDQIAPELHAQIDADIAFVTRQSAQVTVTTAGAPAEILLDKRPVGLASKATPLVVLVATEAGLVHTLRADRQEVSVEHELKLLQPGQTVDVTLEPIPRPTTGRITIASDPQLALVTLGKGGRKLGVAPVPVELPPGDYEIFATLPGRELGRELVHVHAGDVQQITVRLKPLPTWWERNRVLVLIGGGAAVIASSFGIYYGGRALTKPDGVIINYP